MHTKTRGKEGKNTKRFRIYSYGKPHTKKPKNTTRATITVRPKYTNRRQAYPCLTPALPKNTKRHNCRSQHQKLKQGGQNCRFPTC